MSEVYHSSTLGPIPLSFTGRRLMQNLREAFQNAINDGSYHSRDDAVSKARGELAKYMSKLEGYQLPPFRELWDVAPPPSRRPSMLDFAYTAWKQKQDSTLVPPPPVAPPQRTFTLVLPHIAGRYRLNVVGDTVAVEQLPEEKPVKPNPKRYRAKRKK